MASSVMGRALAQALALALVLAGPCLSQSPEAKQQALVQKTVERFFAALRAKDSKAALETWSKKSPQWEVLRNSLPTTIAWLSRKPLGPPSTASITISGEIASGVLEFKGKWSKAEEFYDDETSTVWRFTCHKEAKSWKLWLTEPAVLPVIRILEGLPSKEERIAFLKECSPLIGKRMRLVMETLAEECLESGELKEALRAFEFSLEAAEVVGDKRWYATHLVEKGVVLWPLLSRPREAIAVQREAMRRATRLGDVGLRVTALVGLGGALGDVGETDEAQKWLREALVLTADRDPGQQRALALNFLGVTAARAGALEEARDWYRKSLSEARRVGRKDLELQALAHMAPLLRELGDLGKAFAVSAEGLVLAKQIHDPIVEAKLLNTMGLVHRDTGEYDRAVAAYSAAIERWSKKGLNRLAALGWVNKGDTLFLQEQDEEARVCYSKALELARTLPHEVMVVANAHNNLGNLAQRKGEWDAAIRHYRQSLEVASKRGYIPGQIYAGCNLAQVYSIRRQFDAALEGFAAVYKTAKELGSADGQISALIGMGLTLAERGAEGDLPKAVDAFRGALRGLEHTREGLSDPGMQQGFFAQSAHFCFYLADVLLRMKKGAEAFAAAEQAKARSIVDILKGGRVQVDKDMSPVEKTRESRLLRRSDMLTRKLQTTFLTGAREEISTQIQSLRTEIEDFHRVVYQRRPGLQTLRGRFRPASLEKLNRDLFLPNPGLCVLSYLVGDEEVLLFVLRQGKDRAQLKVHRIRCGRENLRRRIDEFWSQCAVPGQPYRKAGRALHELLLGPAQKLIEASQHVVIIPDGSLYRLPFHALVDDKGKHLIEKHSITYAPSVSALIEMCAIADRNRKTGREDRSPMLAIGAPQMPEGYAALDGARAELEALAKRFEVPAILGKEASETRAKALMPRARRIHLATHGKVNERAPMYSFLVLTRDEENDGLLYAREIAQMDLHAELVVLSACETGRGKQVRGEGLVGLTWALLVAGAPSQLVSNWQVSDEGTRRWMSSFYSFHGASKVEDPRLRTKSGALREAHLAALRSGERAHPYYWAPFFLVGDWR